MCSVEEAKLQSILWAMENMKSHRLDNIIFGVEALALVGAINRPRACPSFHYQASEVCYKLEAFKHWKLINEVRSTNREAFLIAQSVSKDLRTHFYVEVGYPLWLKDIFESE